MTPEDRAALENAEDIVAIANAMFSIKGGDRRRTAVGLLAVMNVLTTGDAVGRVALAALLCEASAELLRDVPLEQLHEAVDVRWWN